MTLPPVSVSFSFQKNESIHHLNALSAFSRIILLRNAGIVKVDDGRYNISSSEGFNAFIQKIIEKSSLNSRKISISDLELNTYSDAVSIHYR